MRFQEIWSKSLTPVKNSIEVILWHRERKKIRVQKEFDKTMRYVLKVGKLLWSELN
jgi:hypothetical protein